MNTKIVADYLKQKTNLKILNIIGGVSKYECISIIADNLISNNRLEDFSFCNSKKYGIFWTKFC